MKLAVVGHAQEKFTAVSESWARDVITAAINRFDPEVIVSGHSPMGGVDLYAEEAAHVMRIKTKIFAPKRNRWDGPGGFKERNLQIAAACDHCLVVVIESLPEGYRGGPAWKDCYHCKGRNPKHLKSGACWTAWKAIGYGKTAGWSIFDAEAELAEDD